MSQKLLSWLLIISLLINISVVGTFIYFRWVSPQKQHEKAEKKEFKPRHERLEFTEEQKDQMRALRKNLFNEIKPLKEEIRQERQLVFEMLTSDSVTFEQIESKIEKIANLETEVQKKSVENLLKSKPIFTEEQREKFLKNIAWRVLGPEWERGHRFRKHDKMAPKQ